MRSVLYGIASWACASGMFTGVLFLVYLSAGVFAYDMLFLLLTETLPLLAIGLWGLFTLHSSQQKILPEKRSQQLLVDAVETNEAEALPVIATLRRLGVLITYDPNYIPQRTALIAFCGNRYRHTCRYCRGYRCGLSATRWKAPPPGANDVYVADEKPIATFCGRCGETEIGRNILDVVHEQFLDLGVDHQIAAEAARTRLLALADESQRLRVRLKAAARGPFR